MYYTDALGEEQLLRRAAIDSAGRSTFMSGLVYDDATGTSIDTQQRLALLSNALAQSQTLGLHIGDALTDAQQAQLQAPLLWYVDRTITSSTGEALKVLVPQLYLPTSSSDSLAVLAGGLIRSDRDVTIDAAQRFTNTGYVIADDTLAIDTPELVNEKRLADVGRIVQLYQDKKVKGKIVTTGSTVQPGAFLSASEYDLDIERIVNRGGELQVRNDAQADLNGDGVVDRSEALSAAYIQSLRDRYGVQFEEGGVSDQTHTDYQLKSRSAWKQTIGIGIVVGVVLAFYTGGAASTLLASYLGSATVVASAATAAVVSTAGSQLVTNGRLDGDALLKAGLASALRAGALQGLGALSGSTQLDTAQTTGATADGAGAVSNTAQTTATTSSATQSTSSIATRVADSLVRASVTAGVQSGIYGTSFGSALQSSLIGQLSAEASNQIGDAFVGEYGGAGHVLAHAALGCATAELKAQGCGSGALGAAVSAAASPYLDQLTVGNELVRQTELLALSTLSAGAIAQLIGADAGTAIEGARNEAI